MKWSRLTVLTPPFHASRALGFVPIFARRNQDGTLNFTTHWTLYGFTLLNVSFLGYVTGFLTFDHMAFIVKHLPSYVPWGACILLSYFSAFVIIGTGIVYRKHTSRLFNEIDELLRQFTGHADRNRLPIEAFYVPATFVFSTIKFLLQACLRDVNFAVVAAYHHSYLICLSSESLATCILFYLESLFKCLNADLSMIEVNRRSKLRKKDARLIHRRLKRLRELHGRISDLQDIFCERFSIDLFVVIGLMVTVLLISLYAGIWATPASFTWLLNAFNVMHYGFIVLRVAYICYRSDCVLKESQVTTARVRSLMTAYLPGEIKQEVYHFTLQTMLRKVEITACGFYSLRIGTVTTIVYLITTSLVMVVNLVEVV